MYLTKAVIGFTLILYYSAEKCKIAAQDTESNSGRNGTIKFHIDKNELQVSLPEAEVRRNARNRLPPRKRKELRIQVAVIGGSIKDPISPYMVAAIGYKCGANLPFIFCLHDATLALQTNSRHVLIFPIVDGEYGVNIIVAKMRLIHSIVIGPGLTPGGEIFDQVRSVIEYIIREHLTCSRISLIFDRYGIDFLVNNTELLRKYPGAVYISVTRKELRKLWDAHFVETNNLDFEDSNNWVVLVKKISCNAVIIVEGEKDIIVNVFGIYQCATPARTWQNFQGEGDVLTGILALHAYYAYLFKETKIKLSCQIEVIAAYAACWVTRKAGEKAAFVRGKYLIATDMYKYIKKANEEFFAN